MNWYISTLNWLKANQESDNSTKLRQGKLSNVGWGTLEYDHQDPWSHSWMRNNIFRVIHYGQHFADRIFKCIIVNEKLLLCIFCRTMFSRIQLTTKSTLRAQTYAAPSLRRATQSIQSCNSLANYFSCPYLEKFREYQSICISIMLVTNPDPENRKKWTLHLRGSMHHPQNVPDCPSCHNGPILKMSRKSTLPFYRNVAHWHANAFR